MKCCLLLRWAIYTLLQVWLYCCISENFCLGFDQLLRSQKNNILWQWETLYLIPFPRWHSNQILSLEGTETPYPGGCRWVPVCSCSWDGESDLRVRLCDSCAEPASVGVVWQHFVRAGSSRRRGKAARATVHIWELHDRSDMADVCFCVFRIPGELFLTFRVPGVKIQLKWNSAGLNCVFLQAIQ